MTRSNSVIFKELNNLVFNAFYCCVVTLRFVSFSDVVELGIIVQDSMYMIKNTVLNIRPLNKKVYNILEVNFDLNFTLICSLVY